MTLVLVATGTGTRTRIHMAARSFCVLRLSVGIACASAIGGCGEPDHGTWALSPIARSYTFAARDAQGEVIPEGVTVSALDLDEGRMAYVNLCASCHGVDGDGRGYASKGLDPPPRDFRTADYKFAAVRSGELPNDDDLLRLIQGGLRGTAMPPWGLPDDEARRIAYFIKTFPTAECAALASDAAECAPGGALSSRWQARSKAGLPRPTGAPIPITEDPWVGRDAEAVRKGEEVYHGKALCQSCHPSYVSKEEIAPARARMFESEPMAADKNPYHDELLPPDFTRDELRSIRDGRELADTYRVIAGGVGGVMPSWIDALSQGELWALARYVRELADLRRPEREVDRIERRRRLGTSP